MKSLLDKFMRQQTEMKQRFGSMTASGLAELEKEKTKSKDQYKNMLSPK